MTRPPVHLLVGPPEHGVTLHARQVARATGAATIGPAELAGGPRRRVHVHVTDRLFGVSAEQAARRLEDLTRRHEVTVTLHDLPQPGDGAVFPRRARTYATVLDGASGWVVSSQHEAALVRRHLAPTAHGHVIPLPVMPLPAPPARPPHGCRPERPVVGVLGWVYPGKGHEEVLRSCAVLGRPVEVRALGAASEGSAWVVRELEQLAAGLGLAFSVSGWIADDELPGALADVDVPVAAHDHVSASGSINSWLAARRRPLVVDGAYSREMAVLRRDTLTVVDRGMLAAGISAALRSPATTWLGPRTQTAPGLDAVAAAYLAWWDT